MGYLDALTALLRKCKRKAREAKDTKEGDTAQEVRDMWKERGARVCLILASQLVEMKVYTSPPSNFINSIRRFLLMIHRRTSQQRLNSLNHFALSLPMTNP